MVAGWVCCRVAEDAAASARVLRATERMETHAGPAEEGGGGGAWGGQLRCISSSGDWD